MALLPSAWLLDVLLAWSLWSSSCCCLIICRSRFCRGVPCQRGYRVRETKQSYDMGLLLGLELLVQLAKTRGAVVVRVGSGRRAREELGAGARGVAGLLGGHLTRGWDRRVVHLEVEKNGSPTAGLRRSAAGGDGAG